MRYTVKQLARLAGVSARTLRYYDEVGLLKPQSYGENGYRYYGDDSILRLQQILFFRELDLSLDEIAAVLNQPDFNVIQALQAHREALGKRVHRLNQLIQTVEQTITHLRGKTSMSDEQFFTGFTPEQEAHYNQRAIEEYGEIARDSIKRYGKLSAAEKQAIHMESNAIFTALRDAMPLGAAHPDVQVLIGRLQKHFGVFYECTDEILLGLGTLYTDNPEFTATFARMHPDLPVFLRDAITLYVNGKKGR